MVDGVTECVADATEFFRMLKGRSVKEGVPMAVAIAPTYRCNFQCVHCFARTSAELGAEMPHEAWMGIIDQLADAGCLFLLITGGEPLLRPDFEDLYARAKERGMLVTVFTNGSLLTESHIRLFKAFPPRVVEMTVYGISPDVHHAATGVEGMSGRCLDAARTLLRAGVPVALKTVVMKGNRTEFDAMRRLAEELGVKFRFDVAVTPRLDGDRSPLEQRLSVGEAVEVEFSDPRRLEYWKGIHASKPGVLGEGPVYRCSGGRASCFIGPDGAVQPCVPAAHRRYPMGGSSFAEVWRRMTEEINGLRAPKNSSCFSCEKSVYCGFCPVSCQMEGDGETGPCRYLCELGERRWNVLEGMRYESKS